eukprot:3273927-Pleurochrysis_carterae.AAC.4
MIIRSGRSAQQRQRAPLRLRRLLHKADEIPALRHSGRARAGEEQSARLECAHRQAVELAVARGRAHQVLHRRRELRRVACEWRTQLQKMVHFKRENEGKFRTSALLGPIRCRSNTFGTRGHAKDLGREVWRCVQKHAQMTTSKSFALFPRRNSSTSACSKRQLGSSLISALLRASATAAADESTPALELMIAHEIRGGLRVTVSITVSVTAEVTLEISLKVALKE